MQWKRLGGRYTCSGLRTQDGKEQREQVKCAPINSVRKENLKRRLQKKMGNIKNGGWFMVSDWRGGGGRQVMSAGKWRSSGAEREKISFRGKEGPILPLEKKKTGRPIGSTMELSESNGNVFLLIINVVVAIWLYICQIYETVHLQWENFNIWKLYL